MELSVAAARVLSDVGAFGGKRAKALVARDPRASVLLEAAVVAGLASAGWTSSDSGSSRRPVSRIW